MKTDYSEVLFLFGIAAILFVMFLPLTCSAIFGNNTNGKTEVECP